MVQAPETSAGVNGVIPSVVFPPPLEMAPVPKHVIANGPVTMLSVRSPSVPLFRTIGCEGEMIVAPITSAEAPEATFSPRTFPVIVPPEMVIREPFPDTFTPSKGVVM